MDSEFRIPDRVTRKFAQLCCVMRDMECRISEWDFLLFSRAIRDQQISGGWGSWAGGLLLQFLKVGANIR
jgi:hypothetical protein